MPRFGASPRSLARSVPPEELFEAVVDGARSLMGLSG